ncbi:hypothetical protein DFH06DRAFT_1408114 [Mycena polygramma]|nr:hypothetical protein DFH06DRAFT_1408114 [Mycena polygramma]
MEVDDEETSGCRFGGPLDLSGPLLERVQETDTFKLYGRRRRRRRSVLTAVVPTRNVRLLYRHTSSPKCMLQPFCRPNDTTELTLRTSHETDRRRRDLGIGNHGVTSLSSRPVSRSNEATRATWKAYANVFVLPQTDELEFSRNFHPGRLFSAQNQRMMAKFPWVASAQGACVQTSFGTSSCAEGPLALGVDQASLLVARDGPKVIAEIPIVLQGRKDVEAHVGTRHQSRYPLASFREDDRIGVRWVVVGVRPRYTFCAVLVATAEFAGPFSGPQLSLSQDSGVTTVVDTRRDGFDETKSSLELRVAEKQPRDALTTPAESSLFAKVELLAKVL